MSGSGPRDLWGREEAMTMGRAVISVVVVLGVCRALAQAQEPSRPVPFPGVGGAMGAPPLGPPAELGSMDAGPEGQSISTLPTSVRPDPLAAALGDRLYESTWYTRQEY